MRRAGVHRIPRRLGVLILGAAASAGCSGGESGTVSATPPSTVAVEAVPSKKGVAPRVPRGPDQAKALQESRAK